MYEYGYRDIAPALEHVGECLAVGGTCDDFHYQNPNCGGFASLDRDEQNALWVAVTSEDTDAIRHALESYPEALSLNMERLSLQIKGCTGDILANLPLSSEQIAALD